MGSNRREGVVPNEVLSDDEMFTGVGSLDSAAAPVPDGCVVCAECGHVDRAENFMQGCPMCEQSTPQAAEVTTQAASGVDDKGFPWDERIHGVARNMNKDGTWRLKRGIDKDLVTSVQAETVPEEYEGAHADTAEHVAERATQAQTEAPQQITADMVISKYVETRDQMAAKTKALKEELADLKVLQEKRELWLQGELTKLGLDSFKSAHGTAFTTWKDSATVADRQVFLDWVHKEWEDRESFLENRVSKSAVKQRLEDGELEPPGINYTKIKALQVRRS